MTKYKKNEIVTGCVTGIERYGIFVSLDDYNSGLIHISEISSSFVRNPADYVSMGETIRVRVLEDEGDDSFHVKLSIKDIDYRNNRKRRNKIVETSKGFSTLKVMLPIWIEEKEKEIVMKVTGN